MKFKRPLLLGFIGVIALVLWLRPQRSVLDTPTAPNTVSGQSELEAEAVAAASEPSSPSKPEELEESASPSSIVVTEVAPPAEVAPDLTERVASPALRSKIEALPPAAQREALRRLEDLSIPESDYASLGVTGDGRFYYLNDITPSDHGAHDHGPEILESLTSAAPNESETSPPPDNTSAAAVPIASPPVRNSRPGSTNVLYLDFSGHTITGTSWNSGTGRAETYVGKIYDTDGDTTTFSDDEQADIIEIWERVAEDFSPFDVNVTTEDPGTFTSTTGRALFTTSVDANGENMPSSSAGGVAQLNVFGDSDYHTQGSPAFVYYDNFSGVNRVANLAEAATHELGHNMGLTHDGENPSTEYHNGTGSGDISWAPIMGASYGKNVSQWSKGEYTDANNQQDDLAIIVAKMAVAADEAGDTTSTAAAAAVTGSAIFNTGVLSSSADVDLYSFSTATGSVTVSVNTYRVASGPHGGNGDVKLELLDAGGSVVAMHGPQDSTNASLTYEATAGTYYARLTPEGSANYTSYGSAGQYTLTGTLIAAAPAITSATTVSVSAGAEFSYSIVGTNGPTSYTATGLPAGLSVDTDTGVISGRATVTGVFTVSLSATNSLGTGNVALTLTVQDAAPAITAQTTGRVVLAPGESTTLAATAISANGSPTYQWQHNGRDVSGATSATLDLSAITRNSDGYYRVQITNTIGTTASVPVFVVVAPVATQVLVWGLNDEGQATVPSDLGAVSQISMGFEFVVALLRDGTVRAWGSDSSGQATVPDGLTDVVQVATGSFHALALKSDGTVVGWGYDFYDQSTVPDGLDDVVYIAAGGSTSLAVKRDGSVVAWGENDEGQATVPAGLSDVVMVEIGSNHVLALKADGTVIAWGFNDDGQTTVAAGATSTTAVAAGYEFSVAHQSDGSIVSWGDSGLGQRTLPDGLTTFTEVATGWYQTIGINADGTVAIWGYNGDGQRDAPEGLSTVFNVDGDRYNSVALREATGDVSPTISTGPATQTVVEGTDVTLSVAASGGTSLLAYQWRKGGVNIEGATSASYQIPDAPASASGSYDVVVSNQIGSITSATSVLTVNAIPVISAQSAARILTAPGADLSLSVTATGTGPVTYQWYRAGRALAGETGSTYSKTGFGSNDGGTYWVTVTDAVGTRRSELMNVLYAPVESLVYGWGWNEEGQTTVPEGLDDAIAVAAGRFHSLALKRDGTVVAWGSNERGEGDVPGDLTDVVQIAAGSYVSYALQSDGTVVEWGSNNFTHTGLPAGLNDVIAISYYSYHGIALQADGTVVGWGHNDDGETSIPSSLGVVTNISVGARTSYALNDQGELFAWGYGVNGETAVPDASPLWTAVTGGGFHAVGLKSDGTAEAWGFGPYGDPPDGLTGLIAVSAGGQHALGLSSAGNITPWGLNDDGESTIPDGLDNVFYIEAGNNFSLAIQEILQPEAPAITSQPEAQTVIAGDGASFSVTATGVPAPTYQWRKGGVDLGGATSASFTIASAAASDAGDYDVVLTNSVGSVTSAAATLAVQTPPSISVQPQSQTVTAGDQVTLAVTAAGDPAPTYQWRKSGVNIDDATSPSLDLGTVALADAGDYDVVVTNSVESITSVTATVTVQVGPAITSQPQSQTVLVGADVALSITATGTPAPTYQWRKDGVAIVGATNASLSLSSVTTDDAGLYDIVITNEVESVTSDAAVVTVNQAPSITTQPASQTVTVGTEVTLSVSATGSPAPTYQWKKDGTLIFGATAASLELGTVALDDAANYSVDVINVVETVTSAAATLTVQAVPEITMQPTSQTVHVGASVAFAVEATGTPAPSYQWRKNGENIDGATSSSLGLSDTGLADAGSYTVAVFNDVETVVSDVATLTVVTISGTQQTDGHRAGETVTVNNTVTYTGPLTQLVWSVVPPDAVGDRDWSLAGSAGTAADVNPIVGTTDLLEWTWNTVPTSPFSFSYTLDVPDAATGDHTLTAMLESTSAAGTLQAVALPDPLVISEATAFHSADTDSDFRINLSELLRVIEIYNTRTGTIRTGRYTVDVSTADGFAPDDSGSATATTFHSADTDRDSALNLSELLRVIELYNTRSGTSRTGAYRIDLSMPDGFAPDP